MTPTTTLPGRDTVARLLLRDLAASPYAVTFPDGAFTRAAAADLLRRGWDVGEAYADGDFVRYDLRDDQREQARTMLETEASRDHRSEGASA